MKRYKIKLSYDGSKFYGWQVQKQTPTVQQTLESTLSEIAKEKILVIGSGRTDTGVHALCQTAHFDFPIKMTPLQIQRAIASKVAPAIQILEITEVSPEFHARYDAIERSYRYIITFEQTPFNYHLKTYLPKYKIDIKMFQTCIMYFWGEHDFTSFAKPNPEVINHVCNIRRFEIKSIDDDIVIDITANRFLHNMIRRIVGAMISVSHNNLDPSIISTWIAQKKHEQKNYITAPPNGLYLVEVVYL
jgi:tRNA pseudouridine38-40 synthase